MQRTYNYDNNIHIHSHFMFRKNQTIFYCFKFEIVFLIKNTYLRTD